MGKTSIQWTDATWNPVRGCEKVSAGCANCYAERFASRFSGPGRPYHGLVRDGRWTNLARFVPEMLDAPLRWKQPRRVFVNSMSDLFHECISDEQIAAVFGVMQSVMCSDHTFQVLTKRPWRAGKWFSNVTDVDHATWCGETAARYLGESFASLSFGAGGQWPPPNVHLGVSIENQAAAEDRVHLLLECPAAVHWVSGEPLLGAVDLEWCLRKTSTLHMKVDIAGAIRNKAFYGYEEDGKPISPKAAEAELSRRLAAGEKYLATCKCPTFDAQTGCKPIENPRIDWVVCGAESGPNRRPCELGWVRSLVNQCRLSGVPVFVKQLQLGPERHVSKEPSEWPEDLKVRMYPGDKWQ